LEATHLLAPEFWILSSDDFKVYSMPAAQSNALPAILILAFSFKNLREPLRRARPEAAHHP